jgi:hypothetical protein
MMATLTHSPRLKLLFTALVFVLGGHFCQAITVSLLGHNPCYNSCNGTVGATASGGTAPYQYSRDNGVTWYTSGLFYGLCPGTYTVIARDAVNATDTATVTLLSVGPLTFTATPTNCSSWSACDGQITFTVSGGTPPYTYIVTNPSNVTTNYTTSPVINLCVGTYTVTVHDQNACSSNSPAGTYTVTITGPGPPPALSISASGSIPICPYTCEHLNASASGGLPPYQYSFNGGPYSSSTQSGCYTGNGSAVSYTVCVRDANNTIACTTVVASWPPPFIFFPGSTNAQCGSCNGSITLNGGFGPSMTYTIDGWAHSQTSPVFNNLCPGTYGPCIISNGQCTAGPATVTVAQTPLTCTAAQTNTTCNGGCNGTITITSPAPASAYHFSADGGTTWQTSNVFTSLCAGTYTITTQNISSPGCTTTNTITITQPPAIVPAATVTAPSCSGGCNGSFTISVTPAGTYQYSINGGITYQSSPTFSGLCAGSYTVTVKNTSNCTANYSFTIASPPALNISAASQTNISCFGGNNGAAFVNASGGTGTLLYNWTPGNPTGDGTDSIYNLAAGNYSCIITDGNNCSLTQTFSFTEPPAISLQSLATTVCYGSCNGMISLSATPADVYQFSADGGTTWQAGNSFSGMCAGNYNMAVMNSSGCTAAGNAAVLSYQEITAAATVTQPLCNGICSGNVMVSASPANSYLYSFDNGVNFQAADSLGGICDGGFTIVVMDPNGCTDTLSSVFVFQPSAINTTASITSTSCGLCNGVTIVSASGGTSPYNFNWNSADPQNLCAGNYSVIITDSNNCTDTVSLLVPSSTALTIDSVSSTGTPSFQSNGTATAYPNGNLPYTYTWDAAAGNQTTQTAINLAAGNYCVTITDADGCSDTTCVNVPVITAITDVNSQNNFSVSPNPFSDELFVSGDGVYHIYLYNTIGQITEDIGMITLNNSPVKLELQKKFSAGIYFIRAENAQGTTIIRLVKE